MKITKASIVIGKILRQSYCTHNLPVIALISPGCDLILIYYLKSMNFMKSPELSAKKSEKYAEEILGIGAEEMRNAGFVLDFHYLEIMKGELYHLKRNDKIIRFNAENVTWISD